ncbi:MAG: hypothetical protein QOH58_3414 [Thermoleophilaceae bacterium]|nr:hypothetical protein [Thermoleophilaceae bacterium]
MTFVAAAGRWAARHEYAAALLFFAAAACVYFWPLLIGHQMGQSHLLYSYYPWLADRPPGLDVAPRDGGIDAALVFHPLLTVAREQLHDGFLPVWNPYSYAGMTLFGDFQTALLYPITWLGLVLRPEDAWGWMAALKLLTAGAGGYAFSRALRIGRGGAVVAGLIYMLAAPLVVWLQWPLGTVFSLFPWLLLATHRLYREPGRRSVAAVALVVMLSIFAGHPETALLSSSAAGVYLIALALADRGLGAAAMSQARVLAQWVAAHALGAVAAAVVLIPFVEPYMDSITRAEHGEALAKSHLPIWGALVYALPNVFGDGKPDYVGPPLSYLIVAAYFGVAALLLAGVATARTWRHPVTIALAAMAAVALMVVFAIPPVSWITQNLPPYSTGNNARVFYVIALAGAVAAGAGFESLARRPLPLRQVALWSGGALAAVGIAVVLARLADRLPAPPDVERRALVRFGIVLVLGALCLVAVGRLRRTVALAIVLAVVAADLVYLQSWNAVLPADEAYPGTPGAVAFLEDQERPFRVSRFRSSGEVPEVFPPNTQALYGIDGIGGYDFPQSKRWADFSWFVLKEQGITRELTFLTPLAPVGPNLTGLRMMNTRYLVSEPGAKSPAPGVEPVYEGDDATVFRDSGALPRAYVVPATRALGDDATLAELVAGQLDPRREALVPPGAPEVDTGGAFRPARVEQVAPDHVRVHLSRGGDGWLVVANAYSGQWEADVDGHATELYPTNYAAMGLPVAGGDRVVDLRLDRTGLWLGAGVSVLGLAGIALLGRRRPGGVRLR